MPRKLQPAGVAVLGFGRGDGEVLDHAVAILLVRNLVQSLQVSRFEADVQYEAAALGLESLCGRAHCAFEEAALDCHPVVNLARAESGEMALRGGGEPSPHHQICP